MEYVKLSPPWVTYYKELQALFSEDPEVKTIFDQNTMQISVYVDNSAKAEALESLLKDTVEFGNVTVKVTVIPSNKTGNRFKDVFATAFEGNEALVGTKGTTNPLGSFNYVIWTRIVAQFFNDNLGDVNGNQTMLFEQVARDVLKPLSGVYHCTAGCYQGETNDMLPY